VYRRSGGHSYGTTVPGPIGSVLSPAADAVRNVALPFASSLCGSCTDVCPVKIDLHSQLLAWRRELYARGLTPPGKRRGVRIASWVFQRPRLYRLAGWMVRFFGRLLPAGLLRVMSGGWGQERDLPPLPAKSFRDEWRSRRAV
jgi:L-lactate dehydrogenase complex protein LldF